MIFPRDPVPGGPQGRQYAMRNLCCAIFGGVFREVDPPPINPNNHLIPLQGPPAPVPRRPLGLQRNRFRKGAHFWRQCE